MALEDTAVKLIAKFGRDVSLLTRSVTPDDAAAPWDATSSEGKPSTVRAVFLDFSADQIDGTVIQSTDVRALVAAKGNAAITTADTILDGAIRYKIEAADLLEPGDVEYIWTLQLRA